MSVIEEAAAALGTDHLQVNISNAWIVATPEASIVHSEPVIEITAAPKRYIIHYNEPQEAQP